MTRRMPQTDNAANAIAPATIRMPRAREVDRRAGNPASCRPPPLNQRRHSEPGVRSSDPFRSVVDPPLDGPTMTVGSDARPGDRYGGLGGSGIFFDGAGRGI